MGLRGDIPPRSESTTAYEKLMVYAEETMAANEGWEGELLDHRTVEERHGIDPAQLAALQAQGRVIAFATEAGRYLYPAIQFVDADVVAGIDRLVAIIGFPGETWRWLTARSPYLDGSVPLEALKLGMVEWVEAAAHSKYDPW